MQWPANEASVFPSIHPHVLPFPPLYLSPPSPCRFLMPPLTLSSSSLPPTYRPPPRPFLILKIISSSTPYHLFSFVCNSPILQTFHFIPIVFFIFSCSISFLSHHTSFLIFSSCTTNIHSFF